jgi:hypothetical protein
LARADAALDNVGDAFATAASVFKPRNSFAIKLDGCQIRFAVLFIGCHKDILPQAEGKAERMARSDLVE